MRHRQNHRGLSLSRIYRKGNRFYYFSPEPIFNKVSGKATKWHPLCSVADGEDMARQKLRELLDVPIAGGGGGDFSHWMDRYLVAIIKRRDARRPVDPERLKLHVRRNVDISSVCKKISYAFADFSVADVLPFDVADFVDQWQGQRIAQVYLSRLSDFFAWACRRGLRSDNPAREVSVEKPAKRGRYITHAEYHAVRDALLLGEDDRSIVSGPMMQCYVDLCYLLYQRATDVRLLKVSDVLGDVLQVTPTKTEHSSGAKVAIPITPAIRAVIDRALSIGKAKRDYLIVNKRGKPYGASGIRSAWSRACARAGVTDATVKDLRAKALTDARKLGYSMQQLSAAAAHVDEKTTAGYVRSREVPVSELVLSLPDREN